MGATMSQSMTMAHIPFAYVHARHSSQSSNANDASNNDNDNEIMAQNPGRIAPAANATNTRVIRRRAGSAVAFRELEVSVRRATEQSQAQSNHSLDEDEPTTLVRRRASSWIPIKSEPSDESLDMPLAHEDLEQALLRQLGLIENTLPLKKKSKSMTNQSPLYFDQLSSLSKIGLCSQGLLSLTPQLGLLQHRTETLQLCCNHLTLIPASIGYLSHLQILSLSHNRLTQLPVELGYLIRLQELRLDHNQLAELPCSIVALQQLRLLTLDHNQLKELPIEMGHLQRLVHLSVSYNPLTRLPAELMRISSLRRLVLEHCPLMTSVQMRRKTLPIARLKELSARQLIRHECALPESLPIHLTRYLKQAKPCTFCGGPYFESCQEFMTLVQRQDLVLPLVYHLCTSHWNNDQERIRALFQPIPDSAPVYGDRWTCVQSLLNPFMPVKRTAFASILVQPSLPDLKLEKEMHSQNTRKKFMERKKNRRGARIPFL